MNRLLKSILGLYVLLTLSFTTSTAPKGCELLHEGEFTYGAGKDMAYVSIKGEDHIEYHDNRKYHIRSKIKWLNECEYDMTMTEVTIPGFPYGPGDVMHVQITKVDGMDIYYTSKVKDQTWKGKFTKIK